MFNILFIIFSCIVIVKLAISIKANSYIKIILFEESIFGGEGFILEEISGEGMAFLEIDGDKVIKDLAPGEVLKVDTGNVVAFQKGMAYEIEMVKGLKNIFLGGEGLFLTKLTGPGRVILQTQNFAEFAGRIAKMIPSKG